MNPCRGGVPSLRLAAAAIFWPWLAQAEGPAQAPRVVALAPNMAELACAAGGCDRLVGVSARSDYPPGVERLPQIGDAFALNLEVILQLKPDLVLAWGGGTPQATIDRLRGLGLNVEVLTVSRLDDVADVLQRLGLLLGTTPIADAAAAAYRRRLDQLRTRWRDATPLRVIYQIETAPAYTINKTSVISSAITLCGGVNVFADLPVIAATVSPEAMLAAAPQVVLFGGDENLTAMREYWQRLGPSPALKHDALYPVKADGLERGTPRLLDGVEQVCKELDDARRKGVASP